MMINLEESTSTKLCPTCTPPVFKPIEEFSAGHSRCRACDAARQQDRYARTHPEVKRVRGTQRKTRQEAVAAALTEGKLNDREIAVQFGCTDKYVTKIRNRLDIPPLPRKKEDEENAYDWQAVQQYYDQGHSYDECLQHFEMPAKIWFAARKLGKIQESRKRRSLVGRRTTYDWQAVQQYYNQGHGRDECMAHFEMSFHAWYRALREGRLKKPLTAEQQQIQQLIQQVAHLSQQVRELQDKLTM